jgi:hypothetical protein
VCGDARREDDVDRSACSDERRPPPARRDVGAAGPMVQRWPCSAIFDALNRRNVRYVVVGGVAVVLHGHARLTADLDGTSTRIASIPDLIRLKLIAGRPPDLADIEALERIDAEGRMTGSEAPQPDGWDAHRRDQLSGDLRSTPLQRLRWLEAAIEFASRAGALPERAPPTVPDDDEVIDRATRRARP